MVAVDQEGGRVRVFVKVLPACQRRNHSLRCQNGRGRQTGARGGLADGQRNDAMDIDISFAPVLDVGHISAGLASVLIMPIHKKPWQLPAGY